jgi:EF hand
MKLHKLAITALMMGTTGLLTPITTAWAATDSIGEKMKTWDPDKDGSLDLAEVNKAAEAKFDSLEKDSDGTLDWNEMRSTKVGKKGFNKADPDKDGTLTKGEFSTIVEARFRAADPDNDGTVSVAELKTKAGQSLARIMK